MMISFVKPIEYVLNMPTKKSVMTSIYERYRYYYNNIKQVMLNATEITAFSLNTFFLGVENISFL